MNLEKKSIIGLGFIFFPYAIIAYGVIGILIK